LLSHKIRHNRHVIETLSDITLPALTQANNQAEKAEEYFDEALDNLSANTNSISKLASKFMGFRQDDYVIKTYEKGNDLLNNPTLYAYELGNAYLKKNEVEKTVENWLLLIKEQPNRLNTIQNVLSNNADNDALMEALEIELYKYIQKKNGRDEYPEMLIWLFLNQKDYESALIQAKALDKRNVENGFRIYSLASNAVREEAYDEAIEAYQYLVDKGETNQYYRAAKSEQLNARKLKITTTPNYTDEDIAILHQEYEDYIANFGSNTSTSSTVRELAHLEANYLYNLPKAITLLEELLSHPSLSKKVKNETKLDLGDLYILKGDVWEATLLYAQVDKDEKDSPLGEDARYRNARLSYYKGEFEWAQAQLDILKGATTELIANDALDLSVFIMDNLGLDTTTIPMEMYARAELKTIQNKNSEAIQVLDSIQTSFPNHVLEDDVLLQKAKIEKQQRNYDNALSLLSVIKNKHGDGILADDAIFMLGDIYQYYVEDQEKAMEMYKLIITSYTDSVLVVEARKRFRALRGDES
ncbi:MAG: tetratricopeptide repeat protein, partial [Chitinophagales bacterium]